MNVLCWFLATVGAAIIGILVNELWIKRNKKLEAKKKSELPWMGKLGGISKKKDF